MRNLACELLLLARAVWRDAVYAQARGFMGVAADRRKALESSTQRVESLQRGFHETHYRNHQAVQARRGARSAVGDRRLGDHGYGSQRLWTSEGTHRVVSGRRVCGRFPAEGEDRGSG